MATLIFSAIGTAIGGPLGGAIGALVGRQVDTAVLGSPSREGARLKELAVTTSSYGNAIPRYFGRMRAAGSIIWATDLVEHKETQNGGKGKPSITSYSYSASFAVALSSRRLLGVGRIWADGNLLRGSASDLKTGGKFRFYAGHGDQPSDPLLTAAEGVGHCPAYRDLAYCVFEDLQLADYGNRIPALTFEIFADADGIDLIDLVGNAIENVDASMPLDGVAGIACEGPLSDLFTQINPIFPLDCDVAGDRLSLTSNTNDAPLTLRDSTLAAADDGFGAELGFSLKRLPASGNSPEILRYYDIGRDYQPGAQRAIGKPQAGQPTAVELPAALSAAIAQELISKAARRFAWARQSIAWRTSEIDPRIRPGALVRIPDQPGLWRVNDWEWRSTGVEMSLWRSPGPAGMLGTGLAHDAGRAADTVDLVTGQTVLVAFELPWDGSGSGDAPAVYVAASSVAKGWAGAALYIDQGDAQLLPQGESGRRRSIMGHAVNQLPVASPLVFDCAHTVVVELLSEEMHLPDATARQLAMGANRVLLGSEVLQYARAVPLGAKRWRLEGLLRGRGGTESAIGSHLTGESFCLLDDSIVKLDGTMIGQNSAARIVAIGLGDSDPVVAEIRCRGITQRPLFPVHPRSESNSDGSLTLRWTRRARGAWVWLDGVDTPLHEQAESFEITAGGEDAPIAKWTTNLPELNISAAQIFALQSNFPGAPITVRQRGTYALSEPLLLTHLN